MASGCWVGGMKEGPGDRGLPQRVLFLDSVHSVDDGHGVLPQGKYRPDPTELGDVLHKEASGRAPES